MRDLYEKDTNIEAIAEQALMDEGLRAGLLEGLYSKDETFRYNCHKVLMHISRENGQLLYPHWDYFCTLLQSTNSYHKMSAVELIVSLVPYDTENRFEGIFDTYCGLLDDRSMVVAVYVAAGSGAIVRAKPALEGAITARLLDIDSTHHPEGRKSLVAAGAIESFNMYFPHALEKEKITAFVKSWLDCSSPKTRKLAREFLGKWDR